MESFVALDNQATAKDIPGSETLLTGTRAAQFAPLDEPITVKDVPGFQAFLTDMFARTGKRGEAAMRLSGYSADHVIFLRLTLP
jgi:hypothetical protein